MRRELNRIFWVGVVTSFYSKISFTYLLFWEIRKTSVFPVDRCDEQNYLSSDSRDIIHNLRSYFLHRKSHCICDECVSSWYSIAEKQDASTLRNIRQCLKFEGNIPHNPSALSLPHHLLNANSRQQRKSFRCVRTKRKLVIKRKNTSNTDIFCNVWKFDSIRSRLFYWWMCFSIFPFTAVWILSCLKFTWLNIYDWSHYTEHHHELMINGLKEELEDKYTLRYKNRAGSYII